MSPLFARSLCFWLKTMGSVFSSTHCALKTSIPFSMLTPQKSLLQFSSELSWHPHCTLLYIVHNMASTAMANTESQCNRITRSTCLYSLVYSLREADLDDLPSATLDTSCRTRTLAAAMNKRVHTATSFFYEFQLVSLLQCLNNGFQLFLSLVHVFCGNAIFNCPDDVKHPVLPPFLFMGH